jgi:polysaccharide deacetylase family protein (PEP-CTERM system associated)
MTGNGLRSRAALSIDVEDWFQVENLRGAIARDTWDARELRVERNVDRILEILSPRGTRATFFILGWMAEKRPALVRRIAEAGHEIACHGYGHELLYRMTPDEVRADVDRAKKLLEDLGGAPVRGYRAPSFSITAWAIPILKELSLEYDSSFFPTLMHDRYGKLDGMSSDIPIAWLAPGFAEVCVSVLKLGKRGLPWSGGGYFRLLPYPIFRQGIKVILSSGTPYVFYLHPWEIDPDQPRVDGLAPTLAFRHYVNLKRCEERLRLLVDDFSWTTVGSLFDAWRESAAPLA